MRRQPRSGDYFVYGTVEFLVLAPDHSQHDGFYVYLRKMEGANGWQRAEGYFDSEQTVTTNENWLRRVGGR